MKENSSVKTSILTSSESLRIYDRELKCDVAHIATTSDKFILENGYYVNEDESIIIKSTDETGKHFKKVLSEA